MQPVLNHYRNFSTKVAKVDPQTLFFAIQIAIFEWMVLRAYNAIDYVLFASFLFIKSTIAQYLRYFLSSTTSKVMGIRKKKISPTTGNSPRNFPSFLHPYCLYARTFTLIRWSFSYGTKKHRVRSVGGTTNKELGLSRSTQKSCASTFATFVRFRSHRSYFSYTYCIEYRFQDFQKSWSSGFSSNVIMNLN